jgi:undecaprenyl-diphosphatase
MDLILLLKAFILGVVEGATEFLPVSSTGHLIIVGDLLDFNDYKGKVFEIVIQLGAILAVCWAYRAKLLGVASGMFSDPADFRFVRNLILAFLPAMVLGALLHGFIKSVLFSPWVVVVSLIVGGIIILVIERNLPLARHHAPEKFPPSLSVVVGFCQALAMIPGVSRSGATIMGALMLKVDRKTATEFSFFLAIPTMLAATVYDIYKNRGALTVDSVEVIAVGFISAFICALIVVKGVIAFISRHGFVPFAWYRIALGTLMLLVLLVR